MSLKELSGKLVLLMALVSANRTSELHALELRFRFYSPDGVTFKLVSLTKKRKIGAPLKECFTSFTHDSCLCVVQYLQTYEKVTKNFRDIQPSASAPLFLSYVKPHKKVATQKIAYWIKGIFLKAGVDSNTFKAHSVRRASTSTAVGKGLHIADVLKTAGWSRESTFQQFHYQSSLAEKNFSQTVLNTQTERLHLQLVRNQGQLIRNSNCKQCWTYVYLEYKLSATVYCVYVRCNS